MGDKALALRAELTLSEYHRQRALGGELFHYRGINIQQPWAGLILQKVKTVEARRYPLNNYKNERLWVIETPGKYAPKEGGARIVGVVRFSKDMKYTSYEQWDSDRVRHCVPKGSSFDWQPE